MLAEAQRLSLLQAMGIDVYARRGAMAAPVRADALDGAAPVVVVCRDDALPARFKTHLARALGVGADRLQWRSVGAAIPAAAAAYVVIGTEAARALGVQLSTMEQNDATIAATAEFPALLHGAVAKRALWQALKPVARRVQGR